MSKPAIKRIEATIKGREYDIEFKQNHVCLFGPNGFGKTGLLNALQYALTGKVLDLGGRDGDAKATYLTKYLGQRSGDDYEQPEVAITFAPTDKKVVPVFVGQEIRNTFGANEETFLEFLVRLDAHDKAAAARRATVRRVLASLKKKVRGIRGVLKVLEDFQVHEPLEDTVVTLNARLEAHEASIKDLDAELKELTAAMAEEALSSEAYLNLEARGVTAEKFGSRWMWLWRGSPFFSGAERVMLQAVIAKEYCIAHQDQLNIFANEDKWLSKSTWEMLLASVEDIPYCLVILQTPDWECEFATRDRFQWIDLRDYSKEVS